ncbi:MAG: KTSC domain-containing protein [Hyphomicrobium sp.]|jgi:hypothetical protein
MNDKDLPPIPITPVKSSSVLGYGHHPDTNRLAVQFKSGTTYHYQDVPPAEIRQSVREALAQ